MKASKGSDGASFATETKEEASSVPAVSSTKKYKRLTHIQVSQSFIPATVTEVRIVPDSTVSHSFTRLLTPKSFAEFILIDQVNLNFALTMFFIRICLAAPNTCICVCRKLVELVPEPETKAIPVCLPATSSTLIRTTALLNYTSTNAS